MSVGGASGDFQVEMHSIEIVLVVESQEKTGKEGEVGRGNLNKVCDSGRRWGVVG